MLKQSKALTVKCSLLSGGAESSIRLWDLENVKSTSKDVIYHPASSTERYQIPKSGLTP